VAKINSIYGEWRVLSANLYSLVETAKANNVEPSVYLKEIFTRLPAATCVEDVEALLP
jgi:hypothetical protein